MKIAVGSTNPVKINAVKDAVEKLLNSDITNNFPDSIFSGIKNSDLEVISIDAPSGVSDQPMSKDETLKGAKNRAKYSQQNSGADFGFGLEGGLEEIDGVYYMIGWVACYSKSGEYGTASVGHMNMPPIIRKKLDAGAYEVGDIMNEIVQEKDVKKRYGAVGVFTNKLINRKDSFKYGCTLALSKFITPKYWKM